MVPGRLKPEMPPVCVTEMSSIEVEAMPLGESRVTPTESPLQMIGLVTELVMSGISSTTMSIVSGCAEIQPPVVVSVTSNWKVPGVRPKSTSMLLTLLGGWMTCCVVLRVQL